MCMKKNWKTYLFWIALAEGVGFLAGLLTRGGVDWYTANAVKPPLTPPALTFPIVWTILYGLMGFAAARVSLTPASENRSRGLNLWILQLTLNFLWSIVFFNFRAYGLAAVILVILLVLIGWMIRTFLNTVRIAGLSQLPYFLWCSFALYLNLGVWTLN